MSKSKSYLIFPYPTLQSCNYNKTYTTNNISGLEEVTTVVTEFEMKLASYDSMPSDMDNLRKAHDDLMTLEAEIQEKQVR